jgi:Leucine-rich repeat (LRR) protein
MIVHNSDDNLNKATFIDSEKKHSRRKYILSTGITLLLIIAPLVFIWFTQEESKYDVASAKIIREVAAAQLKKDPNQLTDEDFTKIMRISISGKELSDLETLEKFINIEGLSLYDIRYPESAIPKWMKILTKLGVFDLNERFALDLSPLGKLKHLESISIGNTPVKNIKMLSSLTKFKMLGFSGKNISDIKPLAKLTNLETLNLSGSNVSNLEPLSELKNLMELHLVRSNVADISPIMNLTNIVNLSLMETKVSDLEPIRAMKKMVILDLRNTQVTDLDPIRSFTKLKYLFVTDTTVSDLKPLKGIIELEELQISNTQISNLESLKGLKNLKRLKIKDCKNITDEQVEDLHKALPKLAIIR